MHWSQVVLFLWVMLGVGSWFGIFAASGWTVQGFVAANLAATVINLVVAMIFMLATAFRIY